MIKLKPWQHELFDSTLNTNSSGFTEKLRNSRRVIFHARQKHDTIPRIHCSRVVKITFSKLLITNDSHINRRNHSSYDAFPCVVQNYTLAKKELWGSKFDSSWCWGFAFISLAKDRETPNESTREVLMKTRARKISNLMCEFNPTLWRRSSRWKQQRGMKKKLLNNPTQRTTLSGFQAKSRLWVSFGEHEKEDETNELSLHKRLVGSRS